MARPNGNRYVALGSSMAAGPGIRPRAVGAPWASGRSARNYPHQLARMLNLDLIDVTFSGATTDHLLTESQRGAPPQIDALDGSEVLVTVTIGGNDVGYVPMLLAATLPAIFRRLPAIGAALDPRQRERALRDVQASLHRVGAAVRSRSPRARVFFVDYLTLLPPVGVAVPQLPDHVVDLARHVALELQRYTAAAADETGCEIVCAGQRSQHHHPFSSRPWTVGAGLPVPWRPWPWHPNAEGMAAVAAMIAEQWAQRA